MFKFLHLLINSTFKYARGVLFALALTKLLVYGIRYNNNNSAVASVRSEQIRPLPNPPLAKGRMPDSAGGVIYRKHFLNWYQLSQSSQEHTNRLPQAISKAILRDAHERSGVPIRNLQMTQTIPKTFSNPCIFKFGEICTREYNPIVGWEVVVQVHKESWTYHVDKSGSRIVLDPKVNFIKRE